MPDDSKFDSINIRFDENVMNVEYTIKTKDGALSKSLKNKL
ncbi:hypothetical protein PL321_05270 [Caloramator sp. mosi_1]|nr:hypothetical protein [Caloramator sp. mosi_1]WDC84961.1 hypothetical protein PL321_05270 [Caloramator sp. mosi_1]